MNTWRVEDPVLIFAAMMLLMLIAPMIISRLHAPGLIGLIVAGILTGPHALGLFELDGTFELLGKVGLLYLMFLAGLEIEFDEFIRHRRDSLVFGATTFFIPQIAGALGARLLFGFSWPASILLASMFASHTLIPFPIVSRLGLTRHRAVAATVGGTILTDTAALLVLAVVAESTTTTIAGWFWLRQGLLLALLVWVGLWLLPRVGYWFFRAVSFEEGADFIFVLAAVFATSYLAVLCGVEPIIGAFLAGLSLNRLIPAGSPLMSRLRFVGNALFIPFFLISVGMRVDARTALLQWRSWAVSLYMIGTVTATKWLAAEMGGKALGYLRDERQLMFGLSVNQAAATLAAVLVGRRIGLFDANVLNGTILMILVTCLLGPWATQRAAERLARTARPQKTDRAPSPRIVVPISHPESAPILMDVALLLRGRDRTTPIYPVTIVQDGVDVDARVAAGEEVLAQAVARAAAAGAEVRPVTTIDVTIAGGIARAIREYRGTMVVMGWSRRYANPSSLLHWLPQDVMDRSRALMVLARIRRPLGGIRRVMLLAPPRIEETPGFMEILWASGKLAALSELHIIASAKTIPVIRAELMPSRSAAPPIFHPMDRLEHAINIVGAVRSGAQDLLVVLSARRGNPGWHPRMDRLPLQITDAFPDSDFIVLYPPAISEGVDAESSDPTRAWAAPDRIHIVSDDRPFVELLFSFFLPFTDGNPDMAKDMAKRIAEREPIELAPDILLIHGHEPGFSTSTVFVVASREGVRLDRVTASPRAVFVLIGPANQPPSKHLDALARIAQACRSSEVRRLLETGTDGVALARALNCASGVSQV